MPQDFSGTQQQEAQGARDRQHSAPQKGPNLVASIREDIRSLGSSILIITQKMKYLVRNEKILGRNLIVLNKKIRTLEERISSGEFGAGASLGGGDVSQLLEKLEENNRKIAELEAQISQLKEGTASQEQLQELKYVIDSINPLEFATIAQVKDIIESKLGKEERKKR
ncbi:MAG TPA: hypothetical protein VI977_01830 [archaeon]|nr:hypothetical protein [archaeon]